MILRRTRQAQIKIHVSLQLFHMGPTTHVPIILAPKETVNPRTKPTLLAMLRSRGCSVMASFLEMQLHGVLTKLTVFAPVDRAMADHHRRRGIGDASEYASILRRHVSPCRICWNDLASHDDDDEGALLRTKLQGFTINVSRHGDVLTLNGGATVIMPEIYRDDWLVVHGISEVLEFLPEKSPPEEAAASYDHPSPSPLAEFDSDDMEEFEASGGQSEMFANMTEDDEDVSHRRFFVYRPA